MESYDVRRREIMSLQQRIQVVIDTLNFQEDAWSSTIRMFIVFVIMVVTKLSRKNSNHIRGSRLGPRDVLAIRQANLQGILQVSDMACVEQIRMDRHTFYLLCSMLREHGRLRDTRHVTVEEMVAMFLHICAHHVKNRMIKWKFARSGETISRIFHAVLNGIIHLQDLLLKPPEAVSESCNDPKWKWFKNCLGALDGTYIKVHVSESEKPRYRTRKNEIATNVLGVCSHDMQFTFILPGWEGSAADSRILRDAVSRQHGLKVPKGFYYLVDAGYPNSEGFLAPYRGQRYHLNDWKDGYQPTTPEELFNMKHSSARNVIERCFGLLKMRWAILRSPSFYPIKTQTRIIAACCLLHNLIRREMSIDPLDHYLDEELPAYTEAHGEPIAFVELSNRSTNWRNNLAVSMFNEWMESRNANS